MPSGVRAIKCVWGKMIACRNMAWRRCVGEPSVAWAANNKQRKTLKLRILRVSVSVSSASCDLAVGRRRKEAVMITSECPIEQNPSCQSPLVGGRFRPVHLYGGGGVLHCFSYRPTPKIYFSPLRQINFHFTQLDAMQHAHSQTGPLPVPHATPSHTIHRTPLGIGINLALLARSPRIASN
jgi:hypothetical protein